MDLAAEQPGVRRVAFVHRHTRHTTQPLLANFNVCERSWPSKTHSYRHDTNTYFASHFGRQSVGWSLIKMCHFVVFARNVKPRWISSGRCCTARSGTLLTTSGCSQTPGPAEGKYSETSHRTGQHSTTDSQPAGHTLTRTANKNVVKRLTEPKSQSEQRGYSLPLRTLFSMATTTAPELEH